MVLFWKYREYYKHSIYKNTSWCVYSRCIGFMSCVVWCFHSFYGPFSEISRVGLLMLIQGLSRGLSGTVYIVSYTYFSLFYTSFVKVYTHCLFSAETSGKTSAKTSRVQYSWLLMVLFRKYRESIQNTQMDVILTHLGPRFEPRSFPRSQQNRSFIVFFQKHRE